MGIGEQHELETTGRIDPENRRQKVAKTFKDAGLDVPLNIGAAYVADGLREERVSEEHVTDGSPCPCGPTTVTEGGFEILPEEPEHRPAPPARGKYPKLLQSLLSKGLAPGKPAMSIRVPEGEEPLLVAEGLKREGRRVGQARLSEGEPWSRHWYVEAWVHPAKDRVVQVLAKEGVAPYTKKPKESAGTP